MSQRVAHGIDLRRAPLDYKNIGVYEGRRRADVYTRNKRCKIDDHIIILNLERVEERFCPARRKDLSCVCQAVFITRWQKFHVGGRIPPDRVFKINLSINYINKSGARA